MGTGHEPVYVVSCGAIHALYRWGVRAVPVRPASVSERHVVLRAVLSDFLGRAAPSALVRARLEDEHAGPADTALTASSLRAWIMRHPTLLRKATDT
jgi:hypothetical protein